MTPSVIAATGSLYTRDQGAKGSERDTLTAQAIKATWSTPQTSDAAKASPAMHQGNLTMQSRNWPTPCASDDNKTPEAHMAMKARMKGGPRNTITSLQVLVQAWPTPNARDHKGADLDTRRGGASLSHFAQTGERIHCSPQDLPTPDGPPSSPSAPTSRLRLNPAFVCWLMGLPAPWTSIAHTSFDSAATESYRSALRSQLQSCLNASGSKEKVA
jgi:hypothetical protein